VSRDRVVERYATLTLVLTKLTRMSAFDMILPPPTQTQAYCDVSALESGLLELPLVMFTTSTTDPNVISIAPSLSFLLQHSTSNKKFVFDLGIRRDWENYPPKTVERIKNFFKLHVPEDVVESLAKGGTSPSDISIVCLSHCHFDHVGDTTPFTSSTFVVGAEATSLFNPGYPADPKSNFASDLLPPSRTKFLSPDSWQPLGPFPHALDFYGDGSLYIVNAPGHLSGHINVLARTSADGAWIYLAADSAHHWDLITGKGDIAVGHPGHFHSCAHQDKEGAEEHIRRIRALCELPRVRVLLAHDVPWYESNKGGPAFWPGKIESL
jgi:glyoxylase-like metal-dependent hydrolase (beta-lactamase superfamily II)